MNIETLGVWKWLTVTLAGVVILLLGAFFGDVAASIRYAGLSQRLSEHEREEGHQVMVEKVNDLEEQYLRALSEIKAKLERQSFVLREIEQKLP